MKILGFGSDHNGVLDKAKLIELIKETPALSDFKCIDFGTYNENKKSDYTDISKQIGKLVASHQIDYGILICGTGVGMSIAANKIEGCRAALIHNLFSAPKSKEHNDSNILCLGSWVNDLETNFKIINLWLNEEFAKGRHVRRVEKIEVNNSYSTCFTYGCFDLLTTPHIKLLEWCKSLSDKLIVGLTSDQHTTNIKGKNRPYLSYEDRSKILGSLSFVDEIINVDENLEKVIDNINPSIIVKGGNYSEEEIRKKDKISKNYDIKLFPYIEGEDDFKKFINDAGRN